MMEQPPLLLVCVFVCLCVYVCVRVWDEETVRVQPVDVDQPTYSHSHMLLIGSSSQLQPCCSSECVCGYVKFFLFVM